MSQNLQSIYQSVLARAPHLEYVQRGVNYSLAKAKEGDFIQIPFHLSTLKTTN